jgi:XTP/dITP diphosphohydrolase
MTRRWVLASANRGKLRELAALLEPHGVAVVPQAELGVPSPSEDARTFVENALIKARNAAKATGLPAIADDSGLCVDALGGDPGVRSARYAGPGADDGANVAELLERLAGVPEARRTARFHCVLVALTSPDDPAPLVACGEWAGRIAHAPSGSGGFGYDPVFFDPRLDATAAELPPEVKNRVSHRGQALARLAEGLAGRGEPGGGAC